VAANDRSLYAGFDGWATKPSEEGFSVWASKPSPKAQRDGDGDPGAFGKLRSGGRVAGSGSLRRREARPDGRRAQPEELSATLLFCP
jgi:hypothetical protein